MSTPTIAPTTNRLSSQTRPRPTITRALPRELELDEVRGLLSGTLTVEDVLARTARLAVDAERAAVVDRRKRIDPMFGPQHTPTADLPDPRVWTQRFAVALVESLAGRRAPAQLAAHTAPDVLARLQRRHRTTIRRGVTPGVTGVRRVRVCLPCDGVVEAAVVARVNGRPTPIALRLNGVDGRWQVTVLDLI